MNKQDRYKLTDEDKAILTRPGGWLAELDRMEREEKPDPNHVWRKVSKVKKVKK